MAFKSIGDKLSDFIDWVKKQLEDEAIRRSIAEDLGLQPGQSVPQANLPQDKLDSINRYRSQANPDKEAFITLLNDVRAIYDSVKLFISAFGVSGTTAQNELVYRLFDLLALNYARLNEPTIYFVVQALGVLVEDSSELVDEDAAVTRFFKALGKALIFAFSPLYYIFKTFGARDETAARQISERVFPQLAAFFAFATAIPSSFVEQLATREIILGWDSLEDPASLRLGFKDLPSLAAKLKSTTDPLAQYILQPLQSPQRALLTTYDGISAPSAELQLTIIDLFNLKLQDADLFSAPRFKNVSLPERLLLQAAQHPQGNDLIQLNKALLKAAYKDELSESTRPLADEISERMLTLAFPLAGSPSSGSNLEGTLDVSLAVVPQTHVNASGLLLSVGGEGEVEIRLTDRWKFVLEASAEPAFSVFLDTHAHNITGHGPVDAPLNVAFVSVPDQTDVTYAFPNRDGTRVEIGQLALSFRFDGTNGGIKAQALRCALVLATRDQDGFLAKVLPADGLRVPFTFGVGYTTDQSFFKEGHIEWPTGHSSTTTGPSPSAARLRAERAGLGPSGPVSRTAAFASGAESPSPEIPTLSGTKQPELGLQQTINIGKTFLVVTLDHLLLGLAPAPDSSKPQADVEVSVSLALNIGPVTATVERIGFELGLTFPDDGTGNAGFADFSMGFKAPTGAGIKVNSPFVTGGGFLFLDQANGQYAGFVQLTIQNRVTVTAIGIIATKLPNGGKGFSFLIMITAEGFKPIPLGLGFTLTGIGGLLAINRTCNEEFLREGIKNKTLGDLLFPKDPIRNAAQIFASLNNAFPARDGSYLFGPVVQICWSTPPLITMDLGLILELGNRRRLVILGRVSAIMPSEKHDLIRLQMNALGIVDFDQNSISLDAVLYDSRLSGKFPITGSMAMRLNWGSAPAFALSIGGFHPAFKPPANFPVLERLAITFSNTDDFRLRTEGYFAITSNTVQFGAKAELFAKAGGFSLEGRVGFDVLIQFDPFAFIAGLYGSVQIKRGSHNLFKLDVEAELTGPRPLRLKGHVTFEIFWFDITIPFDHTFIKGDPPPQLAPVVVMQQLKTALNDGRNWTGQLAESQRRLVTLRESQTADLIPLHPLGRLGVKQNVVPLELDIAKFGNATPADAHLFKINTFTVNGNNVGFDRERDFFAPSQFLALSDDEKLAAPSFELMTAGISVGAHTFLFTESEMLEDEALVFETIILDEGSSQSTPPPPFIMTTAFLTRHLSLGAAARSDLRRGSTERYRPASSKNALAKKGWTIASTQDGSAQAVSGVQAGQSISYAESFQALEKLKQQNPSRAKTLMLVRKPGG